MPRFWCLSLLPLIVVAVAACGDESIGPSTDGPLRLTTSIDDSRLSAGEIGTLTHRLENRGLETVVLHFNDGCQIDSFVRNLGTGQTQQLDGAVCTLALTQLELTGGASKTWETKVGTVAAPPAVVALPSGRYESYATVMDSVYSLRSDTVTFDVD